MRSFSQVPLAVLLALTAPVSIMATPEADSGTPLVLMLIATPSSHVVCFSSMEAHCNWFSGNPKLCNADPRGRQGLWNTLHEKEAD